MRIRAHGCAAQPSAADDDAARSVPSVSSLGGMGAHEKDRLRRLLQMGQALVAELDSEAVLARILDDARELTGARYAALGVLDERRRELGRFVTAGLDQPARKRIGDLPRGRGVLGRLIENPRPLRLGDVMADPQSYGFPPGHPEMHSFLGVPILIRGVAWGNLYLTEKHGGEPFDEADEEAAVVLAQWAAIAIENARVHESSERHREQLERAVRSLETSHEIVEAIGSVADLDLVLELIVKRGRALVGAQGLLIMLRERDELIVAASAGYAADSRGRRLRVSGSTSGEVLHNGRPLRVADAAGHLRVEPAALGVPQARNALLVPMLHRGEGIGVLVAFDQGKDAGEFSDEDEQILRSFAQSAANAVAIKRSIEEDRLRTAIDASDAERARWARELHDETLQALGALRVLLASAQRSEDPAAKAATIEQAIADVELEIGNLREIISDLRPSLLDDLGLAPALEALVERRRHGSLRIASELMLDHAGQGGPGALPPALATAVYRVVQEGLSNVVKHSGGDRARVSVDVDDDAVLIEISDNGNGFDLDARPRGFGLAGMRERVALADGMMSLESGEHGTTVRARLPLPRHEPAPGGPAEPFRSADQSAP